MTPELVLCIALGATILVLTGIVVAQQVAIQRLINKQMSRSFAEYAQAASPRPKNGSQSDQDPPEDLRALQGIQF